MSDRRRKYSSELSDDSYERERRKKSKYSHKEHKRKHKKEHKEHRRERSSHDRKKHHHDSDRDKYRSKYYDERKDRERESKHEKSERNYEKEQKSGEVIEAKKVDIIPSIPDSQLTNNVIIKPEDLPSTSTNNETTPLPSYYNSSVVNAQKFAEQQKKRKLLWQNKKTEEHSQWSNLKFSQDNDGTKANKFMRLMGIKDAKEDQSSQKSSETETLQKSDEMLRSMEQQYEIARNITHLSRGVGFGFK